MGKPGIKPATRDELIARFWSKVNKNGPILRPSLGRCWLWTASTNTHGYGGFRYGGRLIMAHKFAKELTDGPTDQNDCRECDNPTCVRPSHIFRGTQADNLADCRAKGRAFVKVSDADVKTIRSRYVPRKVSLQMLAVQFGVTREQIWHIVKGHQR
jgi:hypothetical protein